MVSFLLQRAHYKSILLRLLTLLYIRCLLPISLVLGTGTGTYVVLKYIFQVLVLVLVLAYKVLVSHLGISPRMAFQGSVSGRPRANQN